MGYIPETVTRRLPSSVVGTLGADTSGEQLGMKLAQAGEKVFSTMLAAQAEKKRTLDIISSQAAIRQFESDMDGISTTNKGNFKADPQGGVDKVFEDGSTLIDSTLAQIKDDNVRAMVAQGTTSSLRRSGNSMRNWANGQKVINGAQDLTSITNADAERLSKEPSEAFLAEAINNLRGRVELYKGMYGKAWPEAMRQAEQSIVKGHINGLEASDPIEGKKFLDENDFGGVFNSEELEKLKNGMNDSIVGWKNKVALREWISVLEVSDTLHQAYKEQKFDTALVDAKEMETEEAGAMTPEKQAYFDTVRAVAAKGTDVNSRHSTNTWNNLNHGLRALNVSSDKTSADAKLNALFRYRAAVWKASADEKITPKQRAHFLDQTLTPTLEQIENDTGRAGDTLGKLSFGWFGKIDLPEDKAFDKVENWLDDMNFSDGKKAELKAQILSEVYTIVHDSREKGQEFSEEEVELLVESYFRGELARQNPALQHIPPEGKSFRSPMTGDRFTILPNGSRIHIK